MRYSMSLFVLVFILLVGATGCSGGGNNPASPDPGGSTGTQLGMASARDSADVTGSSDLRQNPHQLWGLYEVSVDADEGSIEIVPIRTAAIHLNAVKLLEPGGKPGGLQVAGPLEWSDGKTVLDVDIRIVHPFPDAMQFSGFDVKGIVITSGTVTGLSDPDLVMSGSNETRLLNADGFTRWWNPAEFPTGDTVFSYKDGAYGAKDSMWHFSSTLNGFKYFADTLSPASPLETLNQTDRGAFRAGKSNVRHYKLSLKGGPRFNYAVDVSWAPPTVTPPVVPDDFPPAANQPEPWRISAVATENTLYYLSPTGQGGEVKLDIRVYDWQSPKPYSWGGSVKQVAVEWPGLFALTDAEYISDQATYALYQATLTPISGGLTSSNDIEFLIWAWSVDGAGYGGILDPDDVLIAANKFSAGVSATNPPPVITDGVTGNASPTLETESYQISAYDPNGDILTYEWSVEFQGNPYVFDDPGNGDGTIDIDWAALGMGYYTVQAEVSDGVNPPVQATPLDVTVGNTAPEVGQVEGSTPVTSLDTNELYQATVYDPDAPPQVLTYKWSIVPEGDPEDFVLAANPDGTINVDWSDYAIDSYDVNLQVSDGIATVEGTKLTVVKINMPPVVGVITGPTPVTCTDTASVYDASITDYDPGQTLVVKWSIVPSGDPEAFIIPAQPDGSLVHDWSASPFGDYDVNVQADDGYVKVTGMPLTVTKLNTPPSGTAVTGPVSVTIADESLYSLDPEVTDCDSFQTLSYMFSVVPEGYPSNYNISSPDGTITVDWSDYGVGQYTIGCRISDGVANTYATPLDVVVGLAPCEGQAHMYAAPLFCSGYSALPAKDIAFLDSGGALKGFGLAQVGPSTLGIFDANESGSTGVLFTYDLDKKDTVVSLDTDAVAGRILVVTATDPTVIKIIDSSIIAGPCIIGTIETAGEHTSWVALDADSDGGFWAVQRISDAEVTFRLVHYNFLEEEPYYQLDSSGTTGITAQVGTNTDIFDIAINQDAGYLYVFEGGSESRGVVHSYKLNPGSQATYQDSAVNLFSQPLSYDTGGTEIWAGYADIDIDHVDGGLEPCRILVYGRLSNESVELIRLDSGFNVLDVETHETATTSFAINPNEDSDIRNLIMPEATAFQFWETPSDW